MIFEKLMNGANNYARFVVKISINFTVCRSAVMSKKSRVSRQNSGGESSCFSTEDNNAALTVVGCVPTHKETPKNSNLTAFLQAQKQTFEDDSEVLEDEAQVLRAENQKRVEEMLQKAKEDLHKR